MIGSHAVVCAFRKESETSPYGSSGVIACGSSNELPLVALSCNAEKSYENTYDTEGKNAIKNSFLTRSFVKGSLKMDLVYEGLGQLLVCAMGLSNKPTAWGYDTYAHTLKLSDNLHTESYVNYPGVLEGDGWISGDNLVRRGTLCIEKDIAIWEYASCLIDGLRLKASRNSVLLEADFISYILDTASAINTDSATWTIPTSEWMRALFTHMDVRLDDYSAVTPLTSADDIGVSSINLNIDNNLTIAQDSQSSTNIIEPRRTGLRRVSGTLTIPRYNANTLLNKFEAGTPQMLRIAFLGPQINGSPYYYSMWFWLPCIQLTNVQVPCVKDSVLPVVCDFLAKNPVTSPAGFPTGSTNELVVQIVNNVSSNLIRS